MRGALTIDADMVTLGYIALARLRQARGDHADALQTRETLRHVAREGNFAPPMVARAAAAQARLAIAHGDLAAAGRWAEATGIRFDDELSYLRESEYLALARFLIEQGRREQTTERIHDALRLLDRLLEAAEVGARKGSMIEILILEALALHLQGSGAALVKLERALALAAPEGYVRVFVDEGAPMEALLHQAHRGGIAPDYSARLLAAFPGRAAPRARADAEATRPHPIQHPQSQVQDGNEVLTPRELEVLRLLASGRSNQAIGGKLVVAVGTVKRHVNSILGKLQVQSRLEAVARARDLGLI